MGAVPTSTTYTKSFSPMLATLVDRPPPGDFAFEIKWDGVRALVQIRSKSLQIFSRNSLDITHQYPELHALASASKIKSLTLDGEIVALDDKGSPSFSLLQSRMHISSSALALRRSIQVPAIYMIFDLLELNGKSTTDLTYEERRKLLHSLNLQGEHWRTPEALDATFDEALETVQRVNLEGLIAKRKDSPYIAGQRSPYWLKIKVLKRQELVICGWQSGQGNRAGLPGSLLLGYYSAGKTPQLAYAGQCGTGFTQAKLKELKLELEKRHVSSNPFAINPPRGRDIHFTRPELVAEFKFTEWTPDGALRHPVFLGLRADKKARDVVREG